MLTVHCRRGLLKPWLLGVDPSTIPLREEVKLGEVTGLRLLHEAPGRTKFLRNQATAK